MKQTVPIPFSLAETLLFNLNLFKFVNDVDEGYEKHDSLTQELIARSCRKWYGSDSNKMKSALPFLRDCTTLVLLTPAFVFGASLDDKYWNGIGFTIEKEFEISCENASTPDAPPTPQSILEVLGYSTGNLVNSLCDERFGATVYHAGQAIVFKAPGTQLTFASAKGLGAFIQMYVRFLSRAIRDKVL